MQSLDILTILTWLISGLQPEDQVDREPGMPAKHQVIRRVTSRVMACAVVGVCHCIHIFMPPRLQVRLQCPTHVHEGAVKPFSGSVALGVIGGCVGLGDASTLTQLLHNSTFKIAPLVCMQFPRESTIFGIQNSTFSVYFGSTVTPIEIGSENFGNFR